MLKLKRSFLLLLILFLAACGTQTQVPEAAVDDSANIEIASYGGKANVHYKKYVVGHAPKGAKYKIELICKTNDKHQKIILKQTIDIHKYKGYAYSKAYYGVGGYNCVVREVGKEYKDYYVGDHVVIKVKQNGKQIGYVAKNTSSRFETVETPKFKVGKRGTVHVYVTNKFNKVEKKTDVTLIKKFVDGKKYVEVKGKANIYLVCKVGKEYKVVASFAASKYTEFETQQYTGLKCFLKESFHDDSYTLEDVQISLESGKWGDELDTNWKKDGYVVSEHFYVPKSPLKIIIVNVVREKEEEKKELELVIKKEFESDYKTGDPAYGNVVVKLICIGYKSDAFTLGDGEEKVLKLYDDYKDCVLEESYTNDHYVLKHVSFDGKSGTVVGNSATSPKFELKLEDGRIVIIIINGVEKKDKEPTTTKFELEIVKKFTGIDPDVLEVIADNELEELLGKLIAAVDLQLVCADQPAIVIDLKASDSLALEAKARLELTKDHTECVLEETFSYEKDDYKLSAVEVKLGDTSLSTTVAAGKAVTVKFDLKVIDGNIVIIIINTVTPKTYAYLPVGEVA